MPPKKEKKEKKEDSVALQAARAKEQAKVRARMEAYKQTLAAFPPAPVASPAPVAFPPAPVASPPKSAIQKAQEIEQAKIKERAEARAKAIPKEAVPVHHSISPSPPVTSFWV